MFRGTEIFENLEVTWHPFSLSLILIRLVVILLSAHTGVDHSTENVNISCAGCVLAKLTA